MSEHSAIGWTNATWNPVTGCSHVSPGCVNCYAETLSLRMGWSKKPWTAQNAEENIILHGKRLTEPLRWREPKRVFVNSMSDLFHELVPGAYIARVFAVMAAAPQHQFQILTKRAERMRAVLSEEGFWMHVAMWGAERYWTGRDLALLNPSVSEPLPNVWLGVSVEDQRRADERIPLLLGTPAAVRFISAEPLLGPIDLWGARYALPNGGLGSAFAWGQGINWVIIGGESGPNHRPMTVKWAEVIAAECTAAGCAVFVKQDSGPRPGKQGRLSDALWARKEYPTRVPA